MVGLHYLSSLLSRFWKFWFSGFAFIALSYMLVSTSRSNFFKQIERLVTLFCITVYDLVRHDFLVTGLQLPMKRNITKYCKL